MIRVTSRPLLRFGRCLSRWLDVSEFDSSLHCQPVCRWQMLSESACTPTGTASATVSGSATSSASLSGTFSGEFGDSDYRGGALEIAGLPAGAPAAR